jgi:hypothetical protein
MVGARSPIKEWKPERGRSQGRGARRERSAAKRALLLDGSPSEAYTHQKLPKGAPLYIALRRGQENLMMRKQEAQIGNPDSILWQKGARHGKGGIEEFWESR